MTEGTHLFVALRESFLTTTTRPARFAMATVVGGLAMALSPALESIALDDLTDVLHDEQARGSNVLVIESEAGVLDGRLCAAMSAQEGVKAAGGVTAPVVLPIGDPALTTARAVQATAGYFEILWGGPPRSSAPLAMLGSDLGKELSIATGAQVSLGDAGLFEAHPAPASIRAESRGRWVTIPAAALDAVHQCWVEVSPGALHHMRAAIPAMYPGEERLKVSALRSEETTDTAVAAWESRPSQLLHVICGAVGGLVIGSLIAPRRAEYALYRVLGMPLRVVLLLAAIEAVLLLLPALAFAGLASGVLLSVLDPISVVELVSTSLWQLSMTAATASLALGVVAVLLTSGNPATVLRRRG